jgi:hypothetical protein
LRSFKDVQRDLERAVKELKRPFHLEERVALLRKLRALLAEADLFVSDEA